MRILLTGFEPFGGSSVNPSEQVVRALDRQVVAGTQIVTAILPVDWEKSPGCLISAIQNHQPDAVLCLGEASGRNAISIERVALNLLDFRIPDNAGATIIDHPIIADGPAAYFSTLPVREIASAIQAAGIPAELSLTAGSYLCNQIFYHMMHFTASAGKQIPAGFIHTPCLPQQAAARTTPLPSMDLQTILTAVTVSIKVIADQIV
jgi:pyroglutamyl-peptidase